MVATVTAFDGAAVMVDGIDEFRQDRLSSYVALIFTGSRAQEFFSIPAGAGRPILTEAGLGGWEERHEDGKRFALGVRWTPHSVDADDSVLEPTALVGSTADLAAYHRAAIHLGEYHDLVTHAYWVSETEIIDTLYEVPFEDTPDGVRMTLPRSGEVGVHAEPSLVVPMDGIGVFEVAAVSQRSSKRLPAWEGTSTSRGHELFQMGGDVSRHFMLVGDTAFGTLSPSPQLTTDAAVAVLDRVSIGWRPRS